MSAVRTLVSESAQKNGLGGYLRQAEPIIKDLEEAVSNIAEELRGFAVSKGLTEAEANKALVQVGLVEEEATGGDDATNSRLNRLEAFAKAHGFKG